MDSDFRQVVVTGAKGFIGHHLMEALNRRPDVEVQGFDIDSSLEALGEALRETDVVFHLAGANRPKLVEEYDEGNHLFTKKLCTFLEKEEKIPMVVFSSSVQAELDNPYGISKRKAENVLKEWVERTGSQVIIFRLKNVFGKWCRPNYNSVVATFCHNIAKGLPIKVFDQAKKIELVYIDDVVSAFINCLDSHSEGREYREVSPSFAITLGDLARQIESFRESRKTLLVPELDNPFIKRLYATYLSYLDKNNFAYKLTTLTDSRGALAEFLKQNHFGQLFISRTKPGVTRGNHFHHTKAEKFLVVEGKAIIRFRKLDENEVIEYKVSGKEFRVLDIPPGYTHSIENIGPNDLITIFWASEIYDASLPDSYPLAVLNNHNMEQKK
jgi:UDP-2-acetamido-2,6-beta-L-arabino-hexul-4-ose reductase